MVCGLRSAICSLQSAVCKCHTPQNVPPLHPDLQCKEKFEKLISLLVKCVVLENEDVSQFNGFGKSFNKSPCFMVNLEKNRKRKHGLFLFVSLLNALF